MDVYWTLGFILICLLMEAFFSGSEIGVVSADQIELQHHGSELFFIQGDLLMSAALENVGESGLPAFGPPRRVLDRKALGLGDLRDVHPEDGVFFFNTLDDEQGHREIHVVLNWFEELKRRTSN